MMQTVPEHRFPPLAPQPNSVPTQPAAPLMAPEDREPAPFVVPSVKMPAEAIPPGPTDTSLNSSDADIRYYESDGRRPGSVRIAPAVPHKFSTTGRSEISRRKATDKP